MDVPPFHSRGKPSSHFFALAYVAGFYLPLPPSARKKPDPIRDGAFFVLNFSRSKAFTQYTYSTVSAENGRVLTYTRGIDELDTLEYALLRSWQEHLIPPYAWKLYPETQIDWSTTKVEAKTQAAYIKNRRKLAFVINHSRMWHWIRKQFPSKQYFVLGKNFFSNPKEKTLEWKEIGRLTLEHFKSKNG